MIGTISDRMLDPWEIKETDINLWDIAWSLSFQNRYNGHTPVPWSVLSHTGLVHQLCMLDRPNITTADETLWLLMHDAAEAYIGDLVKPIKDNVRFKVYQELEQRVMDTIWSALGYSPNEVAHDLVDRYDRQAAHLEQLKFFPSRPISHVSPASYTVGTMPMFMVAKPEDFVTFVRDKLIEAKRCTKVNDLCTPQGPVADLVSYQAQVRDSEEVERNVESSMMDRIPLENNSILRERI